MKKVRFNNKIDIKYYDKTIREHNNLETLSPIHSPNPKYIIGFILLCLSVFFIIYLTI